MLGALRRWSRKLALRAAHDPGRHRVVHRRRASCARGADRRPRPRKASVSPSMDGSSSYTRRWPRARAASCLSAAASRPLRDLAHAWTGLACSDCGRWVGLPRAMTWPDRSFSLAGHGPGRLLPGQLRLVSRDAAPGGYFLLQNSVAAARMSATYARGEPASRMRVTAAASGRHVTRPLERRARNAHPCNGCRAVAWRLFDDLRAGDRLTEEAFDDLVARGREHSGFTCVSAKPGDWPDIARLHQRPQRDRRLRPAD